MMEYVEGLTKPREDEMELWTVATGNFPSAFAPRKLKRASKDAVDFIVRLEGFCGFHMIPPRGTLCLFLTENDAKAGRNMMRSKGIPTGDNICNVFAPKDMIEKTMAEIKRKTRKEDRK